MDRYPADFPTQVFMSSAQAAWQQPAPAAPDGNWPQIYAPPAPPGRYPPADAPGPPGRYESAEPSGRAQPAAPPGSRRAPAPSHPAGPRHGTATPGGVHPGWDRELAAGAEQYPAAGAHQAAARHLDAPFPPAQDPAQLYPAAPAQAWSPAPPAPRSRPASQRRTRATVVVGAACLAALIAMVLILFVALPG